MRLSRNITILFTATCCLLLALPAVAQYQPNWLSASADCSGDHVTVQASISAGAGIDADWLGWVVARTTVGHCSEWVTVSTVQALPDSGQTNSVEVEDVVVPDQSYRYGIRMVAADGGIIDAPASVFFWPEIHFAYVACNGTPMMQGRLIDGGWAIFVDLCPGACWAPISILNPGDIEPYGGLVGTDLVFELSGEVICGGIEGCGLDVDGIRILAACDDPVVSEARDWSTIKAMF